MAEIPVIVPRRYSEFFDKNGEPTLRFVRWMESVTDNTNSSTDELSAIHSYSTQAQWIQQQINGLPEFTMDTTGFTMDTTDFTMDKVIA